MEAMPIKRLTKELMQQVAQEAAASSRLRKNYDFHELTEKVQRFINVFQPGTYVRPHRHVRSPEINGFEFFLVLQGEMGLLLLDPTGQVLHTERISDEGNLRGIELAEGTYHTLVALAPDTVMLELKEGPYDPTTDKEFMEAFPPEGTAEAQELVKIWQSHFAA